MEIKKFKKINEQNQEIELYIFIFTDNIQDNYPSILIYDNVEDAFSYLLNRVYNYYRVDKIKLQEIDSIHNINDLVYFYEENFVNEIYFYENEHIENTTKIDDWIKTRRDSNKYNL